MRFIETNIDNIKEDIRVAYEGDDDLFDKYHIGKFSYQEAVKSTFDMIKNTNNTMPLSNYTVDKDGNIGYVSLGDKFLYSFGINIHYRNKEILTEFWGKIKEMLGEEFICILYKNNTRAIEWLKKCGMEVVENEFNDNSVTLVYIQ